MAKTRRTKDHNARTAKRSEKLKQKQNSMEVPQFKPFRQVPHVEPDAKLTITGNQFKILQEFLGVFAEPIQTMQQVFSQNLNDGIIGIKYLDNDGREISKEEVQAYMQEVQKYLASQAEQNGGSTAVSVVEDDTVTEVEAEPTIEDNASKRKLKVVTD